MAGILDRNWASDAFLAVVSLFLATVLWVIVRQRETVSETFFLEVVPHLETLHPSVELAGPPQPESVGVEINFPKALERVIRSERMFVRLNLQGLRERSGVGEPAEAPLTAGLVDVILPPRIESARVVHFIDRRGDISSTANIAVRARLRTLRAEVRPLIQGDPPHGFEFAPEDIVIDPPGPFFVAVDRATLQRHRDEPLVLLTEPVHPDPDQRRPFYRVPMEDADAGRYLAGIYAIPGEAIPRLDVVVPLREMQRTAEFEDIAFRYEPFGGADLRVEVEPSSFTVRLNGPMRVIDALGPANVRLRTDAWIEDQPGLTTTVRLEAVLSSDDPAVQARLGEVRREVFPPSVTIMLFEPGDEEPVEPEPTWDAVAPAEGEAAAPAVQPPAEAAVASPGDLRRFGINLDLDTAPASAPARPSREDDEVD